VKRGVEIRNWFLDDEMREKELTRFQSMFGLMREKGERHE